MNARSALPRWTGAAVLAAAALGYAYVILVGAADWAIAALPSDDAFYYFQIARNIVEGNGSTFDGLAPTNGYHPAWMLSMIGIYSVAGGSLEGPVLATLLVNGMLCLATLVLVYQVVERHLAPGFGPVAVAACLLPNVLTCMTNGMETGLLLFAVSGCIWFCYRRGAHLPTAGDRDSLALGAILGFVFLSRLDSVFLAIAFGLANLVSGALAKMPIRTLARHLILMATGFTAVGLPYLVWNLTSFGHLTPISGTVKSSLPAIREPLALEGDLKLGAALLGLNAILVAFVVLVGSKGKPTWRDHADSPLVILVLFGLLHFLYALFFQSWGVYWWHFAISGLTFALAAAAAAGCAAEALHLPRPAVVHVLVVLGVAVAAWFNYEQVLRKEMRHRAWIDGAVWARSNTEDEAVFAIKDAGIFGYFSERPVINLDGKANGYEYLEHLRRGDVETYLRRYGVGYAADIHCTYEDNRCTIAIPRADQPRLFLRMDRDREIHRSAPLPTRLFQQSVQEGGRFTIWRYEPGPPS